MKCIVCQNELEGVQRKFCSDQCNSRYNAEKVSKQRQRAREGLTCVECGNQITMSKNSMAKYCSKACREQRNNRVKREHNAKKRAGVVCQHCGKIIFSKKITKKFCSDKCKDGWKIANSTRWDRIKSRYDLSREEWEDLLKSQGGVCAICKEESIRWHTDHDHSCCPPDKKTCGKCVRGILCNRCNQAIGLLKEKAENFQNAMEYLS